jgi:hypothetical protein
VLCAGKELRSKGLNRIGNMLVPNSNYCLFEDWIMPLLDQMLKEQQEQGTVWTPSKVCVQVALLVTASNCWQPQLRFLVFRQLACVSAQLVGLHAVRVDPSDSPGGQLTLLWCVPACADHCAVGSGHQPP